MSNEKTPSPDSLHTNDDAVNDEKQENTQNVDSVENVETESFTKLAQGLVSQMPNVSEHVIDSHNEKRAEEKAQLEQNQSTTDKRGDTFDPSKHATEEDGTPKFTAAGYFAKKRGRKSGSVIGGQPKQEQQPEVNSKQNQQRAAGQAAANALIMLGMVVGGEEWQPIKNVEHGIDEKLNLESAFADYFAAKDMDDIPAGWALTIAVMGYTLPRFGMPKTQKRTQTLWGKCKQWYINRKLKKHGLKTVSDDKKEGGK